MLSRVFQALLVACLAMSPLRAQADPFVGQWKLSKQADQMKVTEVDANTYAFDFGGGVERIAINGTDQPGVAGTTLSVAADGSNWKVVRKKSGRTLITARWALSKDDNVLTDDFTSFSQDGSTSNVTYVYARKAAGQGFAGTWVSTTLAASTPVALQVRPYESDGLSFIIPSAGQTLNVIFDGKYHAAAPAGSALLGRRLSARVVETTRKLNGKITQTRQIELSPDLKILTITVHSAGKDAPNIYVFERSAQSAALHAVAFAFVHNEIVVQVYVNGSGPYRMLVDTDTSPSVVDAALAKRLKLRPLAPSGQGEGEGSGTMQTYPVELSDVAVGTVHQKRLLALVADISSIGKSLGVRIDGVLGTSFLDGRVVQIDYRCGTIRFLPDAVHGAYAARLTSADGINVSDDVWVGSKRITATFDTGDTGSSVVSRRGIASLGLQAAAATGVQSTVRGYLGTAHYTKGYLEDPRVGHVPLGRIDTVFMASSIVPYDVNIGNRVLSRYVVAFDYQRGLLTLAPPGPCR